MYGIRSGLLGLEDYLLLFVFKNSENKETLIIIIGCEMGQSIEDVEEGEISDSGSVEEISEEDFVKLEAATNNNNNNKPRVWTVQDLYKFPVSRNYSSGLYNLAWAQAVQNKSLDEVLVKQEEIINSNLKRSSSSSSATNTKQPNKTSNGLSLSTLKDAEKVIIDVSGDDDDDEGADKVEKNKEEGELEEGEIDLDSEIVVKIEDDDDDEGLKGNNDGVDANQLDNDVGDTIQLDTADGEENEVERRVNSIREALGTVTMVDAEK